jgi:hypothetical protein
MSKENEAGVKVEAKVKVKVKAEGKAGVEVKEIVI